MKHDTSIIIPAYNEAAWIRETLRSLRAHPLLRECQLIVVDDGSTDDTALLAASWADRVVRLLQNEGKGSALRRGIEVAEGQHFLFVDADLGVRPGK
ncbi:glycosyltransferase family 2 protein [Aneurinibacillus thermoaerophilus]|uniref:glycosyltransferase family 2 protein n=1 Tax=Aneurinibacillus thermoaerophilus TaxID=143495 RepID=UPI002E20C6DB|nr:glycosyltransferase family 2 protein [Aneurinibacillus thermoaerophilus]